ncbi:hypothetical protein K4K49_001012 [Colletotrichum sp. SAR 10_70]|nr:hypothetical protein K4K50_008628 [Colletotrichum sp. SAR 10_71]KAI8200993.1 hypothetical protein K4K49_001012 [Colletotrichum sp. SAR 10_70]KAI8231552.1 hypothetical protein K4K54_013043 [Colletotrichum sp. SAR 10_86]
MKIERTLATEKDRQPMDNSACCTCAKLLTSVPRYHPATEKPLPDDRVLECCARIICGSCIHVTPPFVVITDQQMLTQVQDNPRFASYCPYCQTSSNPATSVLPPNLKDPPAYTSVARSNLHVSGPSAPPPPYTATTNVPVDDEKAGSSATATPPEDTLHFLNHEHDTVASLSLRYGVPAAVLRRANNITSDHLLQGRRTVLIPGEYYAAGISLSPRPIEGEEEELRKSKIRRFMTGCKVSDYDVAVLYLEQAAYDLEEAMEAFAADEAWERDHPVQDGGRRGKDKSAPKNRGPFWRGSA